MAITFSRHRIRFKIDQAKPTPLVNTYTTATAEVYRARALQFDIGVFYDGALCSVANLTSMTLEVKALNTDGSVSVASAPLMTKTVAAAAMDDTLDAATWASKEKQHASITFDVSETGLDMTGHTKNVKRFGVIITAITDVGQRITLGNGYMDMINDGGVTSADTPAAGDPQYLTADETRALLASYVPVMGEPGGYIRLVNNAGKSIILRATDDDPPAFDSSGTT